MTQQEQVFTFIHHLHQLSDQNHITDQLIEKLIEDIKQKFTQTTDDKNHLAGIIDALSCILLHVPDLSSNVAGDVMKEVCFPLLQKSLNLEEVECTASLKCLAPALKHSSKNTQLKFTKECISLLEKHAKDLTAGYGTSNIDGQIHLEVLVNVLVIVVTKTILEPESLDFLLSQLYVILLNSIDATAGHVLGSLLPEALNKLNDDHLKLELQKLWNLILQIYEEHYRPDTGCNSERPYLILCGLANFYFPVKGMPKLGNRLECDSIFWSMLQTGLHHKSSLSRKRSMYLLKRVLDLTETRGEELTCNVTDEAANVFWWDPRQQAQLVAVWQDFILLVETLEEKQVHVIKPLMPRYQKLISATSQPEKGVPLLHTTWITCIACRVAMHESLFLRRWGLATILDLDLMECPLIPQGGLQFIAGPFIAMITESAMYHRQPETRAGQCPPMAEKLTHFLMSLFNVLSNLQCVSLSEALFAKFSLESLNSAAMVFVMRSLSALPCLAVWNATILQHIRELLVTSIRTMDIYLRGALQCYLIQALTRLTDMEKVSLEELGRILACFSRSESLCRGTSCWNNLVLWFPSALQPQQLQKYLCSTIHDILKQGNIEDSKVLQVSRMMLLALDAKLLPCSDRAGPSLESALTPVLEVVLSANTNAYLPDSKVNAALTLLTTLMTEAQNPLGCDSDKDQVQKTLVKQLETCQNEIISYIERQLLENISQVSDHERIVLFSNCIELIAGQCDLRLASIHHLILACQSILMEPEKDSTDSQMKKLAAMTLLPVIYIRSGQQLNSNFDVINKYFSTFKPAKVFSKPRTQPQDWNDKMVDKMWGKLSEVYMAGQWRCLRVYMDQAGLGADYMDTILDSLDLVSGSASLALLHALLSVPQHVRIQAYEKTVNLCWAKVREESKTSYFWQTYEAFIKLAVDAEYLNCSPESTVGVTLNQVVDRIFEMGEEKQGLVSLLVQHLCDICACDKSTPQQLDLVAPILVRSLIHGPIHGRGKRFLLDVKTFICISGKQLGVNQLIDGMNHMDRLVQAHILSMLASLKQDSEVHMGFAITLASLLIKWLGENIRIKAYRNYSNTQIHRQKHRCIVALGVLTSVLKDNLSFVEEIYSLLMEVLLVENQPSLRTYAELYLTRIALAHSNILRKLKSEFDDTNERRSACFCSLMIVTIHLGKLIKDKKTQEQFVLDMIEKLFPLCMVYPVNMRTFAQVALLQLYEVAQTNNLTNVLQMHHIIQSFQKFHKDNQHACRSTQHLLENFMLQVHPEADWSIETLTLTLARLTQVSDDEWLSPHLFDKLQPTWSSSPPVFCMPLRNKRTVLDACQPGNWKLKAADVAEDAEAGQGDVQKKIQPWRHMLPEEDLDQDLQQDYEEMRQGTSQMILVTSLIDKTANLGGLCRTCEIFGVSEFVIGKMKYVQDKTFESLSVTAHKWIPIVEVREHDLKDYLLIKKQCGYTLVGAEQTANSKSLLDYKFPEKTLLLLGNEKEGIPVALLQLLDVCVEIPQAGMIRSLNVHVSGALLIWQYAQQHLFSSCSLSNGPS